ncbi:MAG: hypothetical protein H3C64_02455 [Candidatus Kuenenia stuttgartiensis]|uniref:hypothetical protein n=1 Tax=Kuenenia stuttgartiensis TaxID=174633 RepID=UPI000C086F1B|nr:hypothetical protein [Candidatus Kuenenia stuttgartiensis]MBW7941264.1 hypothetical protein [Candidatus Kuenenia stuttgartiensis]MBZ0191457.1 hypothetical protein [Candidatus Kuenenia stuttgartiensis]MCL4727194.1 hypothetical protein [Candidatus Kuenenia stuttgartiensis]
MEKAFIDISYWIAFLSLFRKIEYKDLSFVDCTSFTLMKKEGIARALTFDAHFEQMSFLKEP